MMKKYDEQTIFSSVLKSDVVICDSDFFSLSLKYNKKKHRAPIVKEFRVGEEAQLMKSYAQKEKIRVMENRFLATAFYEDPEIRIGKEIPNIYWKVAAQIYKGILEKKEDDYFDEINFYSEYMNPVRLETKLFEINGDLYKMQGRLLSIRKNEELSENNVNSYTVYRGNGSEDERRNEYNESGKLIHSICSDDYETWWIYDEAGKINYSVSSDGWEEYFGYDSLENRTYYKNSNGYEFWYEHIYDKNGTQVEVREYVPAYSPLNFIP